MRSDTGAPPILQARRATRSYRSKAGEVVALREVDLSIGEGDFAVILGPSGSGKSTLLNVLSGIDTVDEGEILYRGRPLNRYSDARRTHLRRRSIAVVFQSFELVSLMSCYRNIEYPLLLARLPRAQRRRRVQQIADRLEIGHLLARRVSAVSVGQRQRVAIARALVAEPEVVLGDEITGSLDSRSSRRIYTLLREQQSGGRTFVMVTHDSSLVEPVRPAVPVARRNAARAGRVAACFWSSTRCSTSSTTCGGPLPR